MARLTKAQVIGLLISAYFIGRLSTMISPVGESPWSCAARLGSGR